MVDVAIQQTDHTFRVSFKQTSKGFWYGEFTVRANTPAQLAEMVELADAEVQEYLKAHNIEEEKKE